MSPSYAQLDRELRSACYAPKPPSAEVAAQDEWTCVRLACHTCHRAGLEYRPYVGPCFRRPEQHDYRALAVCEACGRAVEF
jgi:hypothetical protein